MVKITDAVKEIIRKTENIFNSETGLLLLIWRSTDKWLPSDGGGEYCDRDFGSRLTNCGITQEVTTAYFPHPIGGLNVKIEPTLNWHGQR